LNLFLKNISFSYPDKCALREVSTVIPQGLTVLLGPNASGKSTLMKCLAGWLRPSGKITLDETPLTSLSQVQANDLIGYLPQQELQRSSFSVFESVLLGRAQNLSWRPSDEDLECVQRVLQETDLSDIHSRRVDQLSGGQQKMVAIAQALVREPGILLLDEPVNSLDYEHQLSLFALLCRLTRKRGMNTIVALHDLNLASAFADRILVLKEGTLFCAGTPDETITSRTIEEVYNIKADIVRHGNSSVVVPLIPSIPSGE
jgi:iron complex transport system ATP-binding protein